MPKAVWRLVNATAQAIAYSQNMPKSRDYWRAYLNDMRDEGWLTAKQIFTTARTGKNGRSLGTLYALTKEGAAIIAETLGLEIEDVFYPRAGIYASSPFQFPHRAEFIELLAIFLGHQKKRSGSAKLNSGISGNSGHHAGLMTVWQAGVTDEISEEADSGAQAAS